MRTLFACYGLSYACMAGTLTLLFAHAARSSARQGFHNLDARRQIRVWSVPAVIGLASTLTALLIPSSAPSWLWVLPGLMYSLLFLIGPVADRFNRRHAPA
jgi:hypothetical protein